ncbi:MAG: DUF3422 domain-containing protein [Pseudomonadota bacterium]
MTETSYSVSDPLPSSLVTETPSTPDVSPVGVRFLQQRRELINEAHARPPMALPCPAAITRLTATAPTGPDGEDLAFKYLQRMCEETGAPVPREQAKHHAFETGALKVVWERHTEFYSLTFVRPELTDTSFQETALTSVPPAWLREHPGEVLSATHLLIVPDTVYSDPFETARKTFGRDDFAASKAGGGPLVICTDFRPHADGFLRMMIFDQGAGEGYLGRAVQRMVEIDAYRLAAMMALPVARRLTQELNRLEQRLEAILHSIALKPEMMADRTLLDDLTAVSAELEELSQRTSFRFSASRAYYSVVLERIDRLREERIDGRQRIGTFMDRRLGPAMRTCEAVEQRHSSLAERATRAAQLLRARVNVAVEEQNKRLLESLNNRSGAQLRLQETVEGLSVIALTYYAVGLFSYLVEAIIGTAHIGLPKGLLIGLSIPVIFGVAILMQRRIRAKLRHRD